MQPSPNFPVMCKWWLRLEGPQNYPSGKGTRKMGKWSTAFMGDKKTNANSVERAFAGKSKLPMNNQLYGSG